MCDWCPRGDGASCARVLCARRRQAVYGIAVSRAGAAQLDDEFERAWSAADGIEGWLSREQAQALFRIARSVPSGSWIVEIGSHHGRSTVVLALAKPEGVGLMAVDPFGDLRWGGGDGSYGIFLENLAATGLKGAVRVFRGASEEAARAWEGGPIGLLYLDGAHDRRSVRLDIDGWTPFVAQGGTVCLHDGFSSVGVTLAILQRFLASRFFLYCGSVRSLVMFRRQPLSLSAAAGSGARLVLRLGYFARNLLVKITLRRGWAGAARALGHRGEGYPY